MTTRHIPFAEINFAAYQPRVKLTPADPEYHNIKGSLEEFGYLGGMVFNDRTKRLVGGHQRVWIMQDMGEEGADFAIVDLSEDDEKRLNIILNRVSGRWDIPKLSAILRDMQANKIDLARLGFTNTDLDELLGTNAAATRAAANRTLAERFIIPPFTILNAREGWWQQRKAAWISLGIQSELGRAEGAEPGGSKMPAVNHRTGKIARSNSKARAIPGTDAGTKRKKAAK